MRFSLKDIVRSTRSIFKNGFKTIENTVKKKVPIWLRAFMFSSVFCVNSNIVERVFMQTILSLSADKIIICFVIGLLIGIFSEFISTCILLVVYYLKISQSFCQFLLKFNRTKICFCLMVIFVTLILLSAVCTYYFGNGFLYHTLSFLCIIFPIVIFLLGKQECYPKE